MSKDLTKKAIEMLLSGATLVSDPCPYCKGVRVMKDGSALCVSCGKEAKEEKVETILTKTENENNITIGNLDQKLQDLTVALQSEKDLGKQKEILQTMNEILAIKERLGAS